MQRTSEVLSDHNPVDRPGPKASQTSEQRELLEHLSENEEVRSAIPVGLLWSERLQDRGSSELANPEKWP
jgi:hypothetical protein